MRRRIGWGLIAAGVAIWVVYGIVWLTGGSPDAGRFVPFHLAGVLPGFVVNRWELIRGWFGSER